MKKLYILAALLMASTAAHAGNSISFEIDGHKIHIETLKNCDSLSCIKVSAPGLSGSGFGFKGLKSLNDDDDDVASNDPPAPKPAAAPVSQAATAPQPPVAAAGNAPAAAPTTVALTTPAPAIRTDVAPVAHAAEAYAPKPAAVAAAPVEAPTTPLGIWATEENKGNVRVEQCGQNLCGYAVNSGEKVLINMKPSDAKWTGQIHDPDSGRDYDSTIAMKGPNAMRVQGCAFGGMFCGGQTWKRVS
ncbi:MAG: hypothetical protein QOE39_4129 [Bradyrhizobium sp.]|nr:hypothetical protein [Bradyrhizobium sp.]